MGKSWDSSKTSAEIKYLFYKVCSTSYGILSKEQRCGGFIDEGVIDSMTTLCYIYGQRVRVCDVFQRTGSMLYSSGLTSLGAVLVEVIRCCGEGKSSKIIEDDIKGFVDWSKRWGKDWDRKEVDDLKKGGD